MPDVQGRERAVIMQAVVFIGCVAGAIGLAASGPYIMSALATMVGWYRECRWCSDGDTYCDKHGRSA